MQNSSPERQETVRQANERSVSMWKRNLIWTVVIVIGFMVYTSINRTGFTIKLEQSDIAITAPDKSITTIALTDIQTVALAQDVDFGALVQGGQAASGWYGIWQSESWGEYTLCIHPGLELAIQLETNKGLYVINETSDAETRNLYDALNALISGESAGQ